QVVVVRMVLQHQHDYVLNLRDHVRANGPPRMRATARLAQYRPGCRLARHFAAPPRTSNQPPAPNTPTLPTSPPKPAPASPPANRRVGGLGCCSGCRPTNRGVAVERSRSASLLRGSA